MNFPEDLLYTKDHEWAKIENKKVTIGITDHAQAALGDVVYVELPKMGKAVKKGETLGVVESIKAVSDLYSPVSGKVIEINAELMKDPSEVNRDPYGKAWIARLESTDLDPKEGLMNHHDYTNYVNSLKP